MFDGVQINRDLTIVRFGGDREPLEQNYKDLQHLVEECEYLYPGIDLWFKRKVKPGLKSKERCALVAYQNNQPIAAGIMRRGKDAKLCSLRILPHEVDKGLGTLLFALIAAEARTGSERIHFTLPHALWAEKRSFFEKYGFSCDGLADQQYRQGNLFGISEMACSAPHQAVWRRVIETLPGIADNFTLNGNSGSCDLVLSVKPRWAESIINGVKKIEVRRKFDSKWEGAIVWIYASDPQREFVGEARISKVFKGNPQNIWDNWRTELGCTQEEFQYYCKGTDMVSALWLDDIRPFKNPILRSQLETLIQEDLNPPVSHLEVRKKSPWPLALSLGTILMSNR
jgi:predicted transcriptional regulator